MLFLNIIWAFRHDKDFFNLMGAKPPNPHAVRLSEFIAIVRLLRTFLIFFMGAKPPNPQSRTLSLLSLTRARADGGGGGVGSL